MKSKRVAIIADLHCGHLAGLTPPSWQLRADGQEGAMAGKRRKWADLERALWRRYVTLARKLGKVDVLIIAGDCIAGREEKTGSTELVATDRNQQVEIAVRCIQEIEARKIVMVYGTDYHVGSYENYEDAVAEMVGAAKIGAHEWVDVNGLILDVKHHVGSSSVPHTQGAAITREALWNALWAERREQPQSDIIVRGHVHSYYRFETAIWSGVTLPALQGMGCRFGQRRCSRTVDWGLVWLDVRSRDDYDFHPEIVRFQEQSAKAIVI
jgi:predicted phosphodiesterase